MTDSSTRLLDAGLALLGEHGRGALTVRAAEQRAGLSHGSVRHHFGGREAFLVALVAHAAAVEGAALAEAAAPADAIRHWIGPGRTVALARFELALIAARDPAVRAAYLKAREGFIERAGGGAPGRRLVLAVDGLVLDAIVRNHVGAQEILDDVAALAASRPADEGEDG